METDFKRQIDNISMNEWNKLFELIPEIEKCKNFGQLSSTVNIAEGVHQISPSIWADITRKFVQTSYDSKLVLSFDWPHWEQGKNILNNRNQKFDHLDVVTLCKLLTTIIRADRFNDGFLLIKLEDGTITGILKALQKVKGKYTLFDNPVNQSITMKTHPFGPKLFTNTRKVLIGTLPPETAEVYFSNSTNTRLWDLLFSVSNNQDVVAKNKNLLPWIEKENILKSLSLGVTDIIHQYSRTDWDSVQDNHIIPSAYNDIIALIEHTKVEQLLFVYKNAARWFLHSLNHNEPVLISKLKDQIELGVFHKIKLSDRTIECILMPSPLNRGEAGQTLPFKLKYYKKIIKA